MCFYWFFEKEKKNEIQKENKYIEFLPPLLLAIYFGRVKIIMIILYFMKSYTNVVSRREGIGVEGVARNESSQIYRIWISKHFLRMRIKFSL